MTIPLTLALGLGICLTSHAAVTGQWDFTTDLSATVGADLAYRANTAAYTTFQTATIGGLSANVMRFAHNTAAQGFTMTHGIAPNGGGLLVNQYTLIMDIMYPAASDHQWRSLIEANPNPVYDSDGDLLINDGNGIGIAGNYAGNIAADTWYRVAFVFDLSLSSGNLRKFIDGSLIQVQNLNPSVAGGGVDGRWALDTTAMPFTDDDYDALLGYVNSIQIHDVAMPDDYISGLGGATAAGIPVVPEPASGLLFGAGLLLMFARRNRNNG